MQKLKLSDQEFAYMKALALFSPGTKRQLYQIVSHKKSLFLSTDVPTVTPSSMVSSFQDKVVLEFRNHLSSCGDARRFSQLLLRMAPLKAFQARQLEEIFFSGLIGSVQIDSVIPYIIRMEDEYFNGHLTGIYFYILNAQMLH